MQRGCVVTCFLILLFSAGAFAGIWLVKNVSNVFHDDCYVSLGNMDGIAYCHPDRYLEPEKLAEWNDRAFYYLLYPVYTFDEEEHAATQSKRRAKKRKKGSREPVEEVRDHAAPARVFDPADSLALLEAGTFIYTYEGEVHLFEAYTPLQESEYRSYRPFQLLRHPAIDSFSDENR